MEFREPFPILTVADVERSMRFYCDNFGFALTYRWPPEGALEFAFLKLDTSGIGVARRGATETLPAGSSGEAAPAAEFELCLYVDDADRASAHLLARGARQLVPPTDQPWGERLTYFADPDGYRIHVTARPG
jgi:catechol 2,3-dioxygenase-like lactoylglutathione lyase family enzyme